MGRLLDHYRASQFTLPSKRNQAEQDKERAVEEAASLERDIDTLSNNLGKTVTVNLLGPIVHVMNVAEGSQKELKVEVTSAAGSFSYAVQADDGKSETHARDKFHPFMIDWLQKAR